ncbi:MAG: phage scaffolding protein [Firmicutes bacterium]|nr:phage scaffolding protein [Bacillota bacterium]
MTSLNLDENIVENIMTEYGKSFNSAIKEKEKTIEELTATLNSKDSEILSAGETIKSLGETLKGFEGINVQELQNKISTYETNIKEIQKNHERELSDLRRDSAIQNKLTSYKFTSSLAKDGVFNQLKSNKKLKLDDGDLINFKESIEAIIETHKDAFVIDNEDESDGKRKKENKPPYLINMGIDHNNKNSKKSIDSSKTMNEYILAILNKR